MTPPTWPATPDQEPEAPESPLPCTPPNVHNGTYTIKGLHGHRTVKLHTATKGKLLGKRILSLLVGPCNTSDFKGLAFWDDEAKRATLWKKWRSGERSPKLDGYYWRRDWNATEKTLAMFVDLAVRGDAGFWASHGYELLLEGRCVKCNRPLTDPKSIELGIGPVCRGDA